MQAYQMSDIVLMRPPQTPIPKIQEEWTRICKDRKFVQRMAMLPEAYLDNFDDDLVKLSVHIDRLILDAQVRFKCGKHAESEVSGRAQRMHPTMS
jgi:hypothetical protein